MIVGLMGYDPTQDPIGQPADVRGWFIRSGVSEQTDLEVS
jgi:hypothetical protein